MLSPGLLVAPYGLILVVLLIVLARRLGHEWETAGRFLGPAAALFIGALALLPIPYLEEDREKAAETVAMVATWASALGWVLLVLGAAVMASGRGEP